ncbi:hypothetical protein [Methanobrevibacter sp. UBA337]|jgi:orotidine-5'-phosphate decarboxylase|uniref:hypothetical protein n=1 Tax=Methanobrevibacter sp. UBA337 TaxID=1915480 RepID=UPI0039B85A02
MTCIIKELLRKFEVALDLSEELLNFKLNDELKDFTKYYSVKKKMKNFQIQMMKNSYMNKTCTY